MSDKTSRILVVEDDPIIQALMYKGLGQAGYEIITADSGKSMFALLEAEKVDLILLDLGLPDGDALPHIVKIRDITSVPLVVITARERIDDRLMALGLGADDYMTKPIDIRELMLRVGNILSRRGSGPPPTGAPIVVSGDRVRRPPKSQPEETKKRSPMVIFAAFLIGITIAGAGAFWLSLGTPEQAAQLTPETEPLADATSQTVDEGAQQDQADASESLSTEPEPAPAAAATAETSAPETVPSVETSSVVSSVAETVIVSEPSSVNESTATLTATAIIEGGSEIAASDQVDPLNKMSRAEVLGYSWVLDSACGSVPQVDWWRYKDHEDIAEYVLRRHNGDWQPFIDNLVTRLAKMYDIAERGSAAVTPGGDRMEGEILERYIEQSVQRLQVTRCLAEEARLAKKRG